MPAPTFRTSALLVMLALGLTLTACGRRGPLEAPPTPEQIKAEQEREKQRKERKAKRDGGQADTAAAPAETPAGDESQVKAGPGEVVIREEDKQTTDQFNPQLIGRPQKTNRAFVIPKRDFILDPLL